MTDAIYSPYFGTLYDEQDYHGSLGRGTHHSVLQCAEFFDVELAPVETAHIHKFAIIWDEDHDLRVVDFVERLYLNGLLAPVQFIGERKGGVSILLASRFRYARHDGHLEDYLKRAETLADDISGDNFNVEIGFFDRNAFGVVPHHHYFSMIHTDRDKEEYYLRSIDAVWDLGTKLYKVPKTPESQSFDDLI